MTQPTRETLADTNDSAAIQPGNAVAAGGPVEKPHYTSPGSKLVTGAARIRCPFTGDTFVVGENTVTGNWQEFPATKSKEIQEAAKLSGVPLMIAPSAK